MKKIVAMCIVLSLLLSLSTGALAARFGTVEKNEAETLKVLSSKGEYSTISAGGFSGGSAVELNVTKYDDWLNNDYIRFAVPVNQRAIFNIKVGVKKGPDQGIMQLWFSDVNERIGEKIDLYSPSEEYTEINLGDFPCNIQYSGRWFEFRVDGKNPASSGAKINIDYVTLSYARAYEAIAAEIPYLDGSAPVAYGDEPYAWQQVMEGGTGASTHVMFHPTEKGLVYLGTDMGGMYRWNDDTYTWTPLIDTIADEKHGHWLGVDSIAPDPNNPDIVYAAVGTNPNKGVAHLGAVIKSYDRGDTWVETGFTGYFGANFNQRSVGECVGVDPGNSNNVWVASYNGGGLVRSYDGLKTWENVELPVELSGYTIIPRVIAFDPTTKTPNGCTRIYVSVYGIGLLVSEDGGETFSVIENCPAKNVYHVRFSNDGTTAVSTSIGLFIYNRKDGSWKEISPVHGKKFTEVAISPTDPNYMITSWNYGPVGSYGQYFYYTRDGGKNWTLINDNAIKAHYVPRVEYGGFWANVNDIAIDPFNESRVFVAGWQNFYMTEDIFAEKTVWTNYTRGIEHGCITNMISLPVGARLIVSSYDYSAGRFTDVTQYCDEMLPPKETNPARMSFSENNPNFIVRAGKGYGAYSTDNGINWRSLGTFPEDLDGKDITDVVVSSDVHPETGNPAILIVSPSRVPYVTFDLGETWIKSNGPKMSGDKWSRNKYSAADPKSPETLYVLASNGSLYRSDDFGLNFSEITSFGDKLILNSDNIRASFGKGAGIFFSGSGKLYRSTTKGELCKEIGDFTSIKDFALGKEKDENSPATIYVFGTRENVTGIHRSTDNGVTWDVIYNDATAKYKLTTTMVMCADRQTFGVVYVGSSGRGIKYGVPRDAENIFYTNKDDAVKVMINNQLEIFDVEPQLINDRTMVPMRKIFEDVGAVVEWDDATQTVTATRKVSDNYGIDTTTVKLTIGSNKITINGVEQEMDIAPVVINGRTLVPVRFISEALGAKVDWIDEKQLVKITI